MGNIHVRIIMDISIWLSKMSISQVSWPENTTEWNDGEVSQFVENDLTAEQEANYLLTTK